MLDNKLKQKLEGLGVTAFDFDSLWGMLPESIHKSGVGYWRELHDAHDGDKTLACVEYAPFKGMELMDSEDQSPTNAVALLLIWCVESGHVEVGD